MEPSPIVREIQDRQTQVSRRLGQIQQQLYRLEEHYLDATILRGNVIRGWDGYLDFKPRNATAASAMSARREKKTKASDRMLSFSSISAPIPKAELDKDEDAPSALHWAAVYTKSITKSMSEAKAEAVAKATPANSSSPVPASEVKSKSASNQPSAKKVKREEK